MCIYVCMYYVEAGASRDENADFARIHISYFFIPGQTSEWKFWFQNGNEYKRGKYLFIFIASR